MALRITLTLLMTVATVVIAGLRVRWLVSLISSGAAAPDRGRPGGTRVANDAGEVLGQRRLLKWSVPGLAHFFTFWGFVILNLTILEAYGALLINRDFHIPLVGRWQLLGSSRTVGGRGAARAGHLRRPAAAQPARAQASETPGSTARTPGRPG